MVIIGKYIFIILIGILLLIIGLLIFYFGVAVLFCRLLAGSGEGPQPKYLIFGYPPEVITCIAGLITAIAGLITAIAGLIIAIKS